jgi:hypothetical protein
MLQNVITNALIQATAAPHDSWSCIWSFWRWGLWIGVLVGIVGFIVSLFLKPLDKA